MVLEAENIHLSRSYQKFSQVQQHEDDPTRAHVYGYSTKPYPKISANGVCEVKSQGEHGIMFANIHG